MIKIYNKIFYKILIILNLKASCISSRTVNENINMNNCLIKDISSLSGNGGVIFINTELSLIINDTTFYQCTSSGDGGVIYFINGLNINLFKICTVGCKSASTYCSQFALLQTNNNQIFDLITIYNCSNLNGYETLRLVYGKQNISNINISYNNNIYVSGVYYVNPTSMFSNYCSFYNNTVSSFSCIHFCSNVGTISKSNIILNNSPSFGVVFVEIGNYILKECIFDKNKNILLYVGSVSTMQLNNCYFLTDSSSTYGSITNSLIITNTYYYLYSIYSTYYCSYSNLKLNPTISKTIFRTFSFTFIIIIFSK